MKNVKCSECGKVCGSTTERIAPTYRMCKDCVFGCEFIETMRLKAEDLVQDLKQIYGFKDPYIEEGVYYPNGKPTYQILICTDDDEDKDALIVLEVDIKQAMEVKE